MKKPRTEMMLPPTMQECVRAALELDMPESEGRKFYFHYESNGWTVGRVPMVSFASAMGGWHERWLAGGSNNRPAPALSGVDKMILREEYNRVIERIVMIGRSYDSHVEMRQKDREELKQLRKRRDELRKTLGVII
jgi:hypothetical protein